MKTTTETLGTATYSPDDNKLRFYPDSRLSTDDYNRAKAHGFKWAPKQQLFVAPMWTPEREELLIEWCGEIGDEDKSLVERAEDRAERFEDYSEKRAQDADQAHAGVEAIAGNIPLGQPILVGHHSEKRARKDAERIENGMRRAVKMWETSKYWQERAKGAISSAKYKERPDVRARRIKGIEADKRKSERIIAGYERCLKFWSGGFKLKNRETGEVRPLEIVEENRAKIANALGSDSDLGYLPVAKHPTLDQSWHAWDVLRPDGERYRDCPAMSIAEVQAIALSKYPAWIARQQLWIDHYNHRLAYENAMLADGGGLVADRFSIGVGGQVLRRGRWFVVTKLNGGTMGRPQSVSVIGHWATTIPIEEVEDYRAPKEGDFEKVKVVTSKPPLCNYPGGSVMLQNRYHPNEPEAARFATITQVEWDKVSSDYKGSNQVVLPNDKHARHRVRICFGVYCKLPPPAGKELEAGYCLANRTHRYWPVYITDAKRKDPPPADGKPAPKLPDREVEPPIIHQPKKPESDQPFEALKEAVKNGVQVVSAPQLFPTPKTLADRMAEIAFDGAGYCVQICPEMNKICRVLEPSAGTGALIQAVSEHAKTPGNFGHYELVAVEVNPQLAKATESRLLRFGDKMIQGDFLERNGDLGKFDRILMNPPFENGSDIKHIKHAMTFLNPGGRLVAICANGPRQREQLMPLAEIWEDLPEGSFSEQGTNVRTALFVFGA